MRAHPTEQNRRTLTWAQFRYTFEFSFPGDAPQPKNCARTARARLEDISEDSEETKLQVCSSSEYCEFSRSMGLSSRAAAQNPCGWAHRDHIAEAGQIGSESKVNSNQRLNVDSGEVVWAPHDRSWRIKLSGFLDFR